MKCVFSAKALQGLETSGPQTLSSRSDGLMSENKTVSYEHICPRNGGGRGGEFCVFLHFLMYCYGWNKLCVQGWFALSLASLVMESTMSVLRDTKSPIGTDSCSAHVQQILN